MPKLDVLQVRVTADERLRVRARAAELGIDVSTLLRQLVSRHLDRAERATKPARDRRRS